MAQEGKAKHPTKFYRSIQYRSASLNIKPNKLNLNTDKLPAFEIKKSITSKSQSKNTITQLFISQSNINHSLSYHSQSLSQIKPLDLNSGQIGETNPENDIIHNFSTCSYSEAFEQMIQSEQKHSYKRKKMGALSKKLESFKANSKLDRIRLPNIIEYENSQFSALDPIQLPINFIKLEIQKTRKAMEGCPNQLKSIQQDMKLFQSSHSKTIKQFQSEFQQGITKLWSIIRENSVNYQGFIMRSKREIHQLQNFIPQCKSQLESTINHQLQIQKIIFETAPFELTLAEPSAKLQSSQNRFLQSNFQQTYF